MIHVGIGYDVHAFAEGRRLILGGVEIEHSRGLSGHSDADVLLHALCDALLGALGEPDIGHFFPNTDPHWKDVSSLVLLGEVRKIADRHQVRIVNVDTTLVAEAPKILPHVPAMKEKIAARLGLPVGKIGIKATTNEKMGFLGRGEGMAAMAVASVDFPD